jgi:hypothetical protein
MSTYKMIKSLPAKGFDWTSLNTALRAKVTFGKTPMLPLRQPRK